MTAPVGKRRAAGEAVDKGLAQELAEELAQAEERGAAKVRAQVRAAMDEHRRVVRVGDQQVEVVEVAALDEVVADSAS